MNKIIWQIIIPTVIFGGLLTILGIVLESHHFYWHQNFEMTYLFTTLILTFATFRIWRVRKSFAQMREMSGLLRFLAIIFAADVTNTSMYIWEGHGSLWANNQLSPAGAALIASLLLVILTVVSIQRKVRFSKIEMKKS